MHIPQFNNSHLYAAPDNLLSQPSGGITGGIPGWYNGRYHCQLSLSLIDVRCLVKIPVRIIPIIIPTAACPILGTTDPAAAIGPYMNGRASKQKYPTTMISSAIVNAIIFLESLTSSCLIRRPAANPIRPLIINVAGM